MARHRLFRPAGWTIRTVVFYIVFQGIHIAIFAFGWWKQQTDDRLAALNRLTYSVWLSRGAALAASLDASLLVLPHCRECLKFLRPRLRWIPLHESQWFHQQVAYSLLFYTAIHTGSHYVNFYTVEKLVVRPVIALQIHYTQVGGITGHIMLLCLLLMVTTAHPKMRQQFFEGFWYMHHLFIVFFLALLVHGTGCFVRDSKEPFSPFAGGDFWEHCIGYESFRWELFPLTIYLFERIYRFYRSHKDAKVLAVIRRAPNLLEVRFEKEGMDYKPGQWLYVKFPEIVADQWHPFSISSCPGDSYVSVHIQQTGDFTSIFADAFDENKKGRYRLSMLEDNQVQPLPSNSIPVFPRIRIDGPHGSLAQDVLKHEVSVMVGAGIGVTPWVSLLKSIWLQREDAEKSAKLRLKRLEFIWICRDLAHYRWLHDLITKLEAQSKAAHAEHPQLLFRARVYLTRQIAPARLQHDRYSGMSTSSIDVLKEKLSTIPDIQEITAISPPATPTVSTSQFPAEMHYGRPDFARELRTLSQDLLDHGFVRKDGTRTKRVNAGVYYCGPDGAGKDLRDACMRVSSKDVEYRFWKERG